MPALSPTMSSGNLVEWKVKEGQEITAGDLIAEVETDKATLSWENQDDGYVAKLLVAEGTQGIEVGTPVAILVENEDQMAAFKDFQPGKDSEQGTSEASGKDGEAVAASKSDAHEGDSSEVSVSSKIGPAARMLLAEYGLDMRQVKPSGPHGIVTKGDVLAAVKTGGKTQEKSVDGSKKEAQLATASTSQSTPVQKDDQGSRDVQSRGVATTTSSEGSSPAASGYTDIPVTQIRRIIAERLSESKSTIPHIYFSADVHLDAIGPLREALKSQGTKVSVNDCVIKAAALALAENPSANSYWDATKEQPMPSSSVDISVAVATESGLITPIVRDANNKSLKAISAEIRELAGRARANKLKPEEFQGGSFSISNLGMFGVESFSAIINPPQSCILAVGGARDMAEASTNGSPKAATLMTVTLSADARIYDGGVASAFLDSFRQNMENPFRLFA